MCLYPRISKCAEGKPSRSNLIAGRVRTKSPIAPPRITRMRFIRARLAIAAELLVLGHGAGQNGSAIQKGDAMRQPPPTDGSCAPLNLVTEEVGHRDPE